MGRKMRPWGYPLAVKKLLKWTLVHANSHVIPAEGSAGMTAQALAVRMA
jgi:hypothetical protein